VSIRTVHSSASAGVYAGEGAAAATWGRYQRDMGVDESSASGMSLKDLSPAEFLRLSALWDESIDMTPGERDAWLAALERSEPKSAALLRELCASQDESRERRFLETRDLVASHVASLVGVPDDGAASELAPGQRVGPYELEQWWATHLPPPRSIAVLPLANEGGDASQQYFSDGISEDLIAALSHFPELKVIGRSSAFKFRDSKEDSRSIGAKLGVAHLLEGKVRRLGEIVRVSAELIDTSDGSTQWSERYDRPYQDLFGLQDEITRSVASALKAKLVRDEHAAAQSDRPPSGNLEAYNALLQGRFYAIRNTEADVRRAIAYFTRAIELDPNYARAWGRLSRAWTALRAEFLEGAPAQEAHANAKAAADRAIVLLPDLEDAHLAQGLLLQNADLDWRGAQAEFRRAQELAPNDGEAKFDLGRQLASSGKVETAIDLTRQALATEPLRANWYYWLAADLSGLNRYDEAERAIRKAIELQPAAQSFHQTLAIIEIQRGHAQAALEAAQQEPPGLWRDSALALARQIGTDRGAADASLRTLIAKGAALGPYQIAQVYALRNDANETFAWLDRAWTNRDPGINYFLFDPFIQRYREDPRFAAFCRKVGLPVSRQSPVLPSV
jgi:TolB-like protein/Flp pilus assembly protein TadD